MEINSLYAHVRYHDVEVNGKANINLRQGTVRFWFKPYWSSVSQGGTGPQNWARFLEVGYYTDTAQGQWQVSLHPSSDQISFASVGSGQGGRLSYPLDQLASRPVASDRCDVFPDGQRDV